MRVLLVANTLPPVDLSGAGEQVLQLARALEAQGHHVTVLGRGRDGVPGPKLLFPLLAPIAVWRAVRRLEPDVVQVHESDGGLVVVVLRALRGRSRRPLLAALMQVSYVEERRAVRPLLDRPSAAVLARPLPAERRFRRWRVPLQIGLGWLSARLTDLVLAPSAATAAELRRDYGARRVRVVPNVTAEPSGRRAVGGEYLLYLGRLRIRKGLEVLLEAIGRLARRGHALPLVVAGDGERRRLLEERLADPELASVRFAGRQDAQGVERLLGGARALVVPSIYEGMPLVVLEAMAAEVPVVASRVSGIPEVVVDGESGWLVEAEEVDRLSETLLEAWSDPVEAQRRGRAGRRLLDRHYRPRHAAEAWLEAIAELSPAESGTGG